MDLPRKGERETLNAGALQIKQKALRSAASASRSALSALNASITIPVACMFTNEGIHISYNYYEHHLHAPTPRNSSEISTRHHHTVPVIMATRM